MDGINAGVTVMQEFSRPGEAAYQGYIDYMNRSEAQRNNAYQDYSLFAGYNDYMGNPVKTTGLFTKEKDILTFDEKRILKTVFNGAQEKESIMWQTIISFDNRWLEMQGIMNNESKRIDERKLKEVSRMAINKMLKNENLEHAVWSASIHYNTDNIHIHMAAVEPTPMREKKMYVQYFDVKDGDKVVKTPQVDSRGMPIVKEEYVGRFKMKSIEICKSAVVNELLQTKEVNLKINHLIRERILINKEKYKILHDKDMRQGFLELHKLIPNDIPPNLLHYSTGVMSQYTSRIDELSKRYIETYHSKDFEELMAILQKQGEAYRLAYGETSRNFEQSKCNELYSKLGNVILQELKEYRKSGQKSEVLNLAPKQEIELGGRPVLNLAPDQEEEFQAEDVPEARFDEEIKIAEKQVLNLAPDQEEEFQAEDMPELSFEEEVNIAGEQVLNLAPEKKRGFHEEGVPEARSGERLSIAEREVLNLAPDQEKEFQAEDMPELSFEEKVNIAGEQVLNLAPEKERGFHEEGVPEARSGERLNIAEKEVLNLAPDHLVGDSFKQYGTWFKENKEGKRLLMQNVPARKQQGLDILENASKEGNPLTKYTLAEAYSVGRVVEIDLEKADRYFGEAFQIFTNHEKETDYHNSDAGKFDLKAYLQYRIGKHHNQGYGTERDGDKAKHWYEKSGSEYADFALGNLYYYGADIEQNYERAFVLYGRAKTIPYSALKLATMYENGVGTSVSQKDADTQYLSALDGFLGLERKNPDDKLEYQIGKMIYDGKGCTADTEQGMKWLRMAAENRNIHAQYKLSIIYLETDNQADVMQAMTWLTELAEAGENNLAQYALGKVYTDVNNQQYDLQKGIAYLEQAHDNQNKYAAYELGKLYTNPELDICNVEKGISYFEQAAEADNEYAAYRLGVLYTDPELEIYDLKKGVDYLKVASDKDLSYADYRLGKLYTNPELEIFNIEIGITYFEHAAEADNEYAAYRLGVLYTDPELEIYDLNKGVDYLKVASNKDLPYADYRLGKIYTNPELEVFDLQEGIGYLENAQRNGMEPAKYLLGKLYLDKQNDIYNPEKGLKYLRELSDKENSYAQLSLGVEYMKGESVEKNLMIGKVWIARAAGNGNEYASKMLEDMNSNSQKGYRGSRQFDGLDKALMQLNKSMREEYYNTMKNIREYDIDISREYQIEI